MASNQRTNRGGSEHDLRWYFGGDARTAAGDMGLRGIDYEAMASAMVSRSQPDSGAAEDRALRAGDAVRRWRRIHTRLARMRARDVSALWLAYGHAPIRPGVPAVARMTATAKRAARALCDGRAEPTWVEIDTWIARAAASALAPIVAEADAIVRDALLAYARACERDEARA